MMISPIGRSRSSGGPDAGAAQPLQFREQTIDLLGGVLREDGGPEDPSRGRADVLQQGDGDAPVEELPLDLLHVVGGLQDPGDDGHRGVIHVVAELFQAGLDPGDVPAQPLAPLGLALDDLQALDRRGHGRRRARGRSRVGAAGRLDVVDEGLAGRDEAAVPSEGLAHGPGVKAPVVLDAEVIVGAAAVRAHVADGVGIVEAQVALIGLEDLDVVRDRGDDAEGWEDAVCHDQGYVAGFELGLELEGQVLGIAVLIGVNGLEGRIDGVADAEMRGLVDEDGPDLVLEGLDEEKIVEVAGDEVDGVLRPEELGDLPLELDLDRRIAEARPGRRAVSAVFPEGGDAGFDDLGMSVKGEVAGASEIEDALAVDDRFRSRSASHDEASGRGRRVAERRFVVGEEVAERRVQNEEPGEGLRQEFAPAGHLDRPVVRCSLSLHIEPPFVIWRGRRPEGAGLAVARNKKGADQNL
jgi:hypothetical protein